MNNCGLIDVGCHISVALAPLIFWTKVGFIGLVVVLALWGLIWVYRHFGWWGIAVALSVGAAAAVFKKGVDYGRYVAPPPAKPVKPPKNRKVTSTEPGTYDWGTGDLTPGQEADARMKDMGIGR